MYHWPCVKYVIFETTGAVDDDNDFIGVHCTVYSIGVIFCILFKCI